jgi:hypothetical protein
MTQIKTEELAHIVCPLGKQASMAFFPFSGTDMALMGTVFVAGLLVGIFWCNVGGRRKSD